MESDVNDQEDASVTLATASVIGEPGYDTAPIPAGFQASANKIPHVLGDAPRPARLVPGETY